MSREARARGRVFKSAVEPKVAVPLLILVGWLVPAGGWLIYRGHFLVGWVMMLSGALPFVLFLPVRYRLTEELFVVRSGFFRWQIPLLLIFEVVPTRDSYAAPALSRDRLRVRFHTGGPDDEVRVSPRERAAFLATLAAAAPHVVLAGDLASEAAPGPHRLED